ncbi:hypothetical protein COCNU_scaffold001707G000010 [Cocos nucifera]|nr:hypothetical protein [Cocos nucifera]
MPEPLTERAGGVGDDKKKKRATIAKSSHHILAHLKRINHQEVEALRVQGDLRAEVNSLQGKVAEAGHLVEEKVVENENLRGVLRKEELISTRLKATLEAFIKGFELYEGRVAWRFPELDLNFLKEEPNEEAGPSGAAADSSPTEVVPNSSEPTVEVPKPA